MRHVCTLLALMTLAACDLQQGQADAPPTEPSAPRPPEVVPASAAPAKASKLAQAALDDDPDDPPIGESDAVVDPAEAMPTEPEVQEPEEPTAPPDYGLIKPSDPPPDPASLTLHALAGYEVVAIYDKPDIESTKLGYLRIGQRLKVTKKVEGQGCRKGFHQLPHGGYACASKGLVVEKKPPYMYMPPPKPRVDQAFPYDYAFVHKWNVPMWWRIPSAEERKAADEQRAIREAEREGKPLPGEEPAKPDKPEADKPDESLADKLPDVTDASEPDKAEDAPKPAAEPKPEAKPAEPEEEPEPIKLPLNPANPWLERGFFLSLAEKVVEGGHAYWKTARGGYVPAKYTYQYKAKDFEGIVLDEEATFPFGFVMSKKGTRVFELSEDGKLKRVGSLERRAFVDLAEETEIGGKAYMMTSDGQLLRKDALRLADEQALPEGLEPWERWIDVSLDKQMLVAYEGVKPVFVTLVSTGRKGTKEEPFETPTGRWRIRSKHISSTMDGNTASDGNYSIQDVPWAMFFEGSFALHGAFWHQSFGRVRSHGCVNLGPSDARWLFYWTTPFLPEGWHGVHAHNDSPGTTVIVRQ